MNLEVGKHYEVITSLEWISKGSVVEVDRIYNHHPNLDVKLVKGWCSKSGVFSIPSKYLKPIEKVTNKFPNYSFKVSTKGFNKEQLQAAYEWLKECAVSKGLRYNNLRTEEPFRYYLGVFDYVDWECCEHDSYPELPEIKLNITTTTSVTSFEKVDNKVLQIEELIGKLSTQLKEAEQQLKSIKGE